MATTIIRPANREEWLTHRQEGIGSSEVATILGLNPWETPYQLWRRKKGLDAPKEETFAMKAGHYLEDAVSMFWLDIVSNINDFFQQCHLRLSGSMPGDGRKNLFISDITHFLCLLFFLLFLSS